jgi:general stress protein 26
MMFRLNPSSEDTMRPFAIPVVLTLVLVVACSSGRDAQRDAVPQVPRAELSLALDTALVLDSAAALIARHSSVGLSSVDAGGRPRVRTVRAYRLARPAHTRDRFTIFVLTRLSTRKVEQLARNPAATLYFDEDDRTSYATIMGRATIHRDPQLPRLQEFLDSATVQFFWPDYPNDFIILEITPEWLEFIGPGIWNDPDNWRPQAVIFD